MTPAAMVIVGAGQAGGWAARTLRREGYDGRIVLVGDEAHAPYERPPLSKSVLAGEAEPSRAALFKGSGFDDLAVDWRPGCPAARIDRASRTLVLHDGETIPYRRLLLATGGRARALDHALTGDAPVHTLRTIDDALRLNDVLKTGRRLLVVGGGWIGLEVAATASRLGATVHVIEALSRLCARVAPVPVSDLLLERHRAAGVNVLLGDAVQAIARSDDAWVAHTRGGAAIDFDDIVVGIGMVPNAVLARDADLDGHQGIRVDARCATSDPDIFAAGDVAEACNRWSSGPMRLESWQNAQDQGIAAAQAMLDRDVDYDPVPRFWSDQYEMSLQIVGLPSIDSQVVVRRDPERPAHFIAFAVDGLQVRAIYAVHAAREMRALRKLVERRAEVGAARLADHSIPIDAL